MHAIWELECCDCKVISTFVTSLQHAEGTGIEGRQVAGIIYGTFLANIRVEGTGVERRR